MSGGVAQFHPGGIEGLQVLVGEDPRRRRDAGQGIAVTAQHQQMAQVPPAHPGHVSGADPVQGQRNAAHIGSGKGQQEELTEGFRVHFRVTQNMIALFQRSRRQFPELQIFGGVLGTAKLLQRGGARIEKRGQTQRVEKIRQRLRLQRRRGGRGAPLREDPERRRRPLPQGVDLCEQRAAAFIKFQREAARMLDPVLVCGPRAAPQRPEKGVVFQHVRLPQIQPRQAGFQVGDHVLILPAPADHGIGGLQKGGQRLAAQGAAPRGIEGDAIAGKGALQRGADALKVPRRHGDVPPAAAGFPHKTQAFRSRRLALLGKVGGAEDGHGLPGVAVRFPE